MDLTTVETKARIACRIYLTLFDAGDGFGGTAGGAILDFNDLDPRRGSEKPDHALVCDVLDSLKQHHAVFGSDGSRPMFYSLDDTLRNRMTVAADGGQPLSDRVRSDLRRHDRGDKLAPLDLVHVEVWIRTGYKFGVPL